jgi:hypothetical protein
LRIKEEMVSIIGRTMEKVNKILGRIDIRYWFRTEKALFLLVILLLFLIPFQQRFYKLLQPISVFLVNPNWHFPAYFEIHLDAFISDFIIIALIVWCIKKGMIQWRSFFWEKERKYLSLFLLFSLVSILNSDFAAYPLHYWRWIHLALPAFLFFFLSRTEENIYCGRDETLNFGGPQSGSDLRDREEGDIQAIPPTNDPLKMNCSDGRKNSMFHSDRSMFGKLAKVVLVVALMESAIAIFQYFIQHSIGLKGLGEPTLISRHYLGAGFPMIDGSVWILDRFFYAVRENAFVLRASGTLPHPNVLGGFMVFTLLMTYYLYGSAQKRSWLALAIFLQTFCLFITYSRSALFTAGLMTMLWIIFTSLRERKFHSLFWVSAGSCLVCLTLLYPQLFERGGIVSYNQVAQVSDTLRMSVQDVGLAMLCAHPFLGVGFNNYMLAFQRFSEGQALPATYIHNIYLHLGVEIGIFGLLAFLVFCSLVLLQGWKNRQQPAVLTSLCIFIGILLIGIVDFYPLCVQQMRLIFFLAAGLLVSPGLKTCWSVVQSHPAPDS